MSLEVGGQAVVDGVMLRSGRAYAIAVRARNGKIKARRFGFTSLTRKNKILGLPFVRGIISTGEMLYIGMRSIIWSSEQAENEKITKKELGTTLVVAILIVIGLFIALPLLLTKLIVHANNFFFNLIDGLFRLALFVSYVWLIGFFKDVQKLYQYHGAEHKVVNCYEAGKSVNVQNAGRYNTLHLRCGTSFIFIVFIVSIFLFSFIADPRWLVKFVERVALIPVITAIGYELLKLSARFKHNSLIRMLISPGLLIQKLTTKEPSEKQLEVAVASFKTLSL